jgi:hypothetical protein
MVEFSTFVVPFQLFCFFFFLVMDITCDSHFLNHIYTYITCPFSVIEVLCKPDNGYELVIDQFVMLAYLGIRLSVLKDVDPTPQTMI